MTRPRRAPSGALILRIVWAAAVLASLGCENDGGTLFPDPTAPPPVPGEPVSLARNVQPILTARCASAGCHAGPTPALDLILEGGRLYDPQQGAVGVQSLEVPPTLRIEAGSAARSYLVNKLTGVSIVGDRMPPGDPLEAEQLDVIRRWIDEGARDN